MSTLQLVAALAADAREMDELERDEMRVSTLSIPTGFSEEKSWGFWAFLGHKLKLPSSHAVRKGRKGSVSCNPLPISHLSLPINIHKVG